MTLSCALLPLSLLLVSACAAAPARPPPSAAAPEAALLRKADLLADADVLQRSYEALHPGLYRYSTPEQMRARFDGLRAALDRDQPLAQAYLAFSQFAAAVKCGHTYANFYNQPKAIQAALFEQPNRVPFYFRWLDGRMVITRNFSSDASLVPGTEVLAIDGVEARAILEQLMTVARADGGNDAKRMAWLEVQGEDRYEAFDIFLPLFFPQIGARQRLLVRAPGAAAPRETTVDALTFAARLAARPEPTEGDGPLWTLNLDDPQLAILRMPTWALYNSKWDWRAFLESTFAALDAKRVPALAIDLRGNEGGQDVGHVLLAHLIERDLRTKPYRRLVRYRTAPAELLPYLDTWDPSFKDWGAAATPVDERFFQLTRDFEDASGTLIHPALPRYAGRVFVLVGATNSSATFEFAQAVQEGKLGTLVGQPTGGNQRGINGGAFFFLRLPRTEIELDLPLIGQFPLEERPDAGLVPDLPVKRSVEDFALGRDAELAAVRARLAR